MRRLLPPLLEFHDFGACRTVAVGFDAGIVRETDIFAVDGTVFAEGDSQPDLDRVEDEPLVSQTHSETERRVELVLEDVGRIAEQAEIGKSEEGE